MLSVASITCLHRQHLLRAALFFYSAIGRLKEHAQHRQHHLSASPASPCVQRFFNFCSWALKRTCSASPCLHCQHLLGAPRFFYFCKWALKRTCSALPASPVCIASISCVQRGSFISAIGRLKQHAQRRQHHLSASPASPARSAVLLFMQLGAKQNTLSKRTPS